MSPYLARQKLSYPLYGVDFDPLNQDFLLVGGGGGEGSSGVANKISLINTSRRTELSEIVDIDLSRKEDSVTSLAVAQSTESGIVAFAGINSSAADQNIGKNEHFRSFNFDVPAKRAAAEGEKSSEKIAPVTTEALSRIGFFRTTPGTKQNTYQRILRLSPIVKPGQARIAALATGDAPENEIVVLKASSSPQESDVLARMSTQASEIADIDIRAAEEDGGAYALAYCTDYEVFAYALSSNQSHSLYKLPESSTTARAKFRALRFLSARHVLLLQNFPGKTGSELLILKLNSARTQGQITLQKRLSSATKIALGLDTCLLSESSTGGTEGDRQIIVAVNGLAGQDSCIELLTLEYSGAVGGRGGEDGTCSSFRPYKTLRKVHSGPVTAIRFSTFVPPPTPVAGKATPPQSVKLATASIDCTVVVHTLPLLPTPDPSSSSSSAAAKTPRYVLVAPRGAETLSTTFSVVMAILVVGLASLLIQAVLEIRGGAAPTLGAADWLSPGLRDVIARPYMFAPSSSSSSDVVPVATILTQSGTTAQSDIAEPEPEPEADDDLAATLLGKLPSFLHDLVHEQAAEETPMAIVIRDDGSGEGELATELHGHDALEEAAAEAKHNDEAPPPPKLWDQLAPHQQEGWKRRLSDAGHWSEAQGVGILKGIFFSELGGIVGGIVGGP